MQLHDLYATLFQLRPGLLYNNLGSERAVRFLKDNQFLGTKDLATFACDSFWSCADKDHAWERAVRFLKDNHLLDTKHLVTFSCNGFWSCADKDDA
jgi:hypothetical protein